jgi:adenine C2-methylase RlmN of 23S rRNA A2503 and tRNA A37
MGMGEPLMNYNNMMKAIEMIIRRSRNVSSNYGHGSAKMKMKN